MSEFNIVSRHRHASDSPESPCVRANYVLVSVRCNIGAPQAGTCRQFAYALTENTRCRRPGTYIRPTCRPERRQPRTGRTPLGSGTRRSAQGRGYLRMQRCAGLSGSQIRRPRHPAGREIHRPRRQHSPGFPLRPVPFIALRLLPLETDERQQFDRNGNACAGRTQRQKLRSAHARGAHRMGTPDRPGHRLFVGHNRSLRQHRQGDPLCGASAGKPQEIPARRASPPGKDLPRRTFRSLYALQGQARRRADRAMYRPAPQMAGDGRPLRTAPPRHDGLHDARLCQNGIPARPDLPR